MSSSPGPSATELPPKRQVEAAVRTYYAELTRAAQTQDTDRLRSLVNRSCPCYGSAQSIEETASKGRTTPDARWTVRRVRIHDVIANSATAEVKYDVSAYAVLGPSGRVISRFPARKGHVDLSLVLMDRGWVLANVFNLGG